MNTATIREKLASIREKYRAILQITAALGSAPERETLDTALARRADILNAITGERRTLDSISDCWLDNARGNNVLAGIVGEIVATIRSIADMDAVLTENVTLSLNKTRDEIRTMYHTSRAAYAYSAHSMPSYRHG